MDRRRCPVWAAWVAVSMIVWTSVSRVWAASPSEEVKTTVERVLAILRDPHLRGESKKGERREQLRQALLLRFDFTEMAKRSLGSDWQRYPARQKEFVAAFTDLIESAYVGKIESYNNEKISYVRERLERDLAEVDTKVAPKKGEEIPIQYKLRFVGGEWKVYDVLIDNISLVNNYRSQFRRVLASASFEELLKRMQEKKLEGSS